MLRNVRRVAQLAIVCTTALSLGGCLISGLTGSSNGGVFSGQATVTLQDQAPCTSDTIAHTTSCDVVIHAQLPSGPFGIEGLAIGSDDSQTVISGPVADQAALHGLLNRVCDLGLILISVRRLGPG